MAAGCAQSQFPLTQLEEASERQQVEKKESSELDSVPLSEITDVELEVQQPHLPAIVLK